MNTNPDEERLALWLDDELSADEAAGFETGLDAGHFAMREETRKVKAMLAQGLPREEEPPYADFFNHRIAKEISATAAPAAPAAGRHWSLKKLFFPLGAVAGMVLAFFLGMHSHRGGDPSGVVMNEIDVSNAPRAIPVENFVYTPDRAVEAQWFDSKDASAVVMVLTGIDAIPDQVDFSETAFFSSDENLDMADLNSSEEGGAW